MPICMCVCLYVYVYVYVYVHVCVRLCMCGLALVVINELTHNNNTNTCTQVYNFDKGCFEKAPWWQVKVGSLVRVTTLDDGCSPLIPCDLAMLASSNLDGTAFLETANLDGETNLKVCIVMML